MMDTQEVFKDFMPSFEKLTQMAQQRQNKPPPLPPEAQVVKDTSMAETQRKTQADQAKQAYEQAKLQMEQQAHVMDNQTKVDIENAKLTHQTIQHANELAFTPPPAAPAAPQPPQGGQDGIGQ
jgi:coenzyme F420-reducing hydrogenase alpha subunit